MSDMKRVYPYVDLVGQHAAIKGELLEAVASVIDHGGFIGGKEVEAFETQFASCCGARYAIGVNSGTDALILALRALGIGAGDEVLTAPNSYIATASSIALVGAKPVFVDVRDDLNIDPDQLERHITPASKAIMPVHLTGRPADMDPIREIAKRHGLYIIEDGAQAVLAEYGGRRVGSLGDVGCFSLHPLKTLSACGDGGIITTDEKVFYEKLLMLRNIGHRNRNEVEMWSGNSRLDSIQAAILLVKLRYVDEWTQKRRVNAARYIELLGGIPEISLPVDAAKERAVYHTFVIQADRRDGLADYLAEQGIGTAVHYPIPIHLQEAAASLGYGPGSFSVTEEKAGRILSLPIYPDLNEGDIAFIAEQVRSYYRN
jgi:dTDP-4-amino-4,6-dideoxygalactose transaminase